MDAAADSGSMIIPILERRKCFLDCRRLIVVVPRTPPA